MDVEVLKIAVEYISRGIKYTLLISVTGIIFAFILGVILWQLMISKNKLAKGFSFVYGKIFRCTPFMIQAYIMYYGASTLKIKIPAVVVGIIIMSLYNAAYIAMILESGMRAVPKGQFESCKALGIPYIKMITRIILPQMLPVVMPPISSQFITAVKDSSILSVITITEMTMMANQAISKTFSYVEVYVVLALAYWLLNIIIECISKKIEKQGNGKKKLWIGMKKNA